MAYTINNITSVEEDGKEYIKFEMTQPVGKETCQFQEVLLPIELASVLNNLITETVDKLNREKAEKLGYKIGTYYNVKVLNNDTGHSYYRITLYGSLGFVIKGNETIIEDAPISKMY